MASGAPLNLFRGSNKTVDDGPIFTRPEICCALDSSSESGLMRAHIDVSEASFATAGVDFVSVDLDSDREIKSR